ncbi:hypothetical protein [Plastoroseomonas hellenica]|uniref:hypothetical protein n=1 Tax=Plastoroseomonas hellenica TaxID=2687306 RepID=UPI001BA96BF4|nr:hypothetical protein [Plastoroseomonas hellenica]MBR0643976.1 hypothetical protein [Plastoroseomonas hellenica]
MTIQVSPDVVDAFGGTEALQARVDAFRAALVAHRSTIGQPAPVEHAVVDFLARSSDDWQPGEPPPPPASPPEPLPATPSAFTSTPAETPFPLRTMTAAAFFLLLPDLGLATRDEAIAAARTGAVPEPIDALFEGLTQEGAFAARVRFARMTQLHRLDQLTQLIAAAKGWSDADVDALFERASMMEGR